MKESRPASLEPATEKNILMFLVKIFKQTNFLTDIKDPHNVEISGRFDLINIARAFQRFGQPRRESINVEYILQEMREFLPTDIYEYNRREIIDKIRELITTPEEKKKEPPDE